MVGVERQRWAQALENFPAPAPRASLAPVAYGDTLPFLASRGGGEDLDLQMTLRLLLIPSAEPAPASKESAEDRELPTPSLEVADLPIGLFLRGIRFGSAAPPLPKHEPIIDKEDPCGIFFRYQVPWQGQSAPPDLAQLVSWATADALERGRRQAVVAPIATAFRGPDTIAINKYLSQIPWSGVRVS